MLSASLQKGVSLIELMIGLVILGILLMVGLPSYSAWIQNTQIRTAAESILNGMQLARAEAVRRNANVQLVFGAASSWTVSVPGGAQIQTRTSDEGSKNVTVAMTPAGATTVTFNALGKVVANADASASITQVAVDVPVAILSAAESRDLRIVVSAGGNIRMCDPNVAAPDSRSC